MKKNVSGFLLSTVLLMCSVAAGAVGTQPSIGNGSTSEPYQIATKDNLLWFADFVNRGNLTACAILTADITVNTGVLDSSGNLTSGTFETWTPIGNWGLESDTGKGFSGEFNGCGHTISGLYFNDENISAVGLFGMADNNGYIHDVGVKDSYFRGKSHVAGICGDLAYGRIGNCWNGATVIGASGCAGGLTGSCGQSSSVSGCYNIGNVSSAESKLCGGICGSVSKNTNYTYSVSNCVTLYPKCDRAYNLSDDADISVISNVFIRDAKNFASGEACWTLNGNKIDTKWRQQIGEDTYPVFTGNFLVNYYNSYSSSYFYNETMCEHSSNQLHNFEEKTLPQSDGGYFTCWHCKDCGNDYCYEGEAGHANQTKELGEIKEDANFIITKTDGTTVEQNLPDNDRVFIDESEGDIKSIVVSENVENVDMIYIRNFTNADKWQGWYVPFDVSVADMAQAGLDVAEIYGILLDNDGDAVVAFLKMDAGTVKANTPYVVRPNDVGKVTVTTTSTLYPTNATQFTINSAKDTYTIGGIYEQTVTPGNWYAINKEGRFQKMGTDVSLRPFRIWMTIDPREDNPYEPYAEPERTVERIDIVVMGDDVPTGMETIDNGELTTGDSQIYNLQGQKVTDIRKGQVYIFKGKKYIAQ